MDFNRLSKLKLPEIAEPEDLYKCGELLFYDKTYDRVSVKAEKALKRINKEFHKVIVLLEMLHRTMWYIGRQ